MNLLELKGQTTTMTPKTNTAPNRSNMVTIYISPEADEILNQYAHLEIASRAIADDDARRTKAAELAITLAFSTKRATVGRSNRNRRQRLMDRYVAEGVGIDRAYKMAREKYPELL